MENCFKRCKSNPEEDYLLDLTPNKIYRDYGICKERKHAQRVGVYTLLRHVKSHSKS